MVEMEAKSTENKTMKKVLLVINCLLLFIGNSGGPLVLRLYFIHGGKRIWLSSWLQTGGWPIMLIPLTITYLQRRRRSSSSAGSRPKAQLILMNRTLFAAATTVGLVTGFVDYLYASGMARLPVSTSSLIIATQLAFTACFAFLLVKQKFTSFSINAIILLTVGAGILALHASGDRPEGVSHKEYNMGFLMTLAAAGIYGFVLPFVEFTYKKLAKTVITYSLVMEFQMVMCFFATLFCTVGMYINNDFKVIPREARNFELGETKYYVVVVLNAIVWQTFFMGATGVIFSASSLLSGIIIAVSIPATEVFAVIFYHESFHAEKGVSLALCIWGFISYFYGEMKQTQENKAKNVTNVTTPETEIPQIPNNL